MNIIRPLDTACTSILDYNVTQTYVVWDVATSYAKGDFVIVEPHGATVYESLTSSNVGNDPATSPLDWLPVGTSNYYAMFDDKNGTQTENANSIEIVIAFDSIVNAIALINIVGTSARFEAWAQDQDWTIDTPVLDETVALRDYGVSSWYDYFTYEVKQLERYVSLSLPTLVGGVGRLTLNAPSAVAKLGSLVYGNNLIAGDAQYGYKVGIKDYSLKDTDEFGNYLVLTREFRREIQIRSAVDNGLAPFINNELSRYKSRPLVWVGDQDDEMSIIYGFYRDYNLTKRSPAFSILELKVEGL